MSKKKKISKENTKRVPEEYVNPTKHNRTIAACTGNSTSEGKDPSQPVDFKLQLPINLFLNK